MKIEGGGKKKTPQKFPTISLINYGLYITIK